MQICTYIYMYMGILFQKCMSIKFNDKYTKYQQQQRIQHTSHVRQFDFFSHKLSYLSFLLRYNVITGSW